MQNPAPPQAAPPGEGLPDAEWRERSTRLGQAAAGSAATRDLTYRRGEVVTALAVSMEGAQVAMEMETARAATVVASLLVAPAEPAPSAPGDVVSPALADSEARLAAAAFSPEAGALRGSGLVVGCRVAAPAANRM